MKRIVCALFFATTACARDNADTSTPPATQTRGIKECLELRARYNIPNPEGEPAIYVDSAATHYTSDEQCVAATRDADGHWRINAVVEEGPGLLDVKQHLVSNDIRSLSDSEGHQLDELLKQPDLYREESQLHDPPGVGGMIHAMEIDTPVGHTVIQWTGRLLAKAGAVADLIIGRGKS